MSVVVSCVNCLFVDMWWWTYQTWSREIIDLCLNWQSFANVLSYNLSFIYIRILIIHKKPFRSCSVAAFYRDLKRTARSHRIA